MTGRLATPAPLLDTGRVGIRRLSHSVMVMDEAPGLFRYASAHWLEQVRNVARGCEAGETDREMWHRLFTDEQRLATHRAVYGNRGAKKAKPKPPSLFDKEIPT